MLLRRFSLSQRLLIALLFASFAFWLVIAWLTIRDSIKIENELFDAQIKQTAIALLRVADSSQQNSLDIRNNTKNSLHKELSSQFSELPNQPTYSEFPSHLDRENAMEWSATTEFFNHLSIRFLQEDYEQNLRYQIWNVKDQLLLRSANAPFEPPSEEDGYSENTDKEGHLWRNYSQWNQHHDLRVVVTESHDVRHKLVRHISIYLLSPLVLGLPVLIFLLWLSINQSLSSLSTLIREIDNRKPDNLTPLDENIAPEEVRPMVLALNDLLQRFIHSLESERRFTSDAAHELRTPLAAIQAQLYAARNASNESERLQAMAQLQLCVERGIRLVSQLLTLARLDPEQSLPDAEQLNLADVAQAVCAEQAPLALQRGQTLELQVEPELPSVVGNADILSMLLSNLLDNAIRYTPRDGHINVDVRRHTSGCLIEISDDGPGISTAQREQVFHRFFRLAGQDQPGTGLGLAICRRIADLHNASIELIDGAGGIGLTVRVLLPDNAK
jgi:two-component system sensor histidine kinase QseC